MAAPHFSTSDDTELAGRKAEARRAALARRADAQAEGAGEALAAQVLAGFPPLPGAVVAGFWPMPGEIDIRPLMAALAARGHALCLPRTPCRGLPLAFHAWAPGEELAAGPMGTRQPPAHAPALTPGFFLVPLLAFRADGRRLGYGGGYYDRTLALHPAAPRLGVAYAVQEMPDLPAGPLDLPLDAVATEAGLHLFGPRP